MATYTCTSGFSISGSATITCQANGGWEPEPACTMDRELLSESVRLIQLLCSLQPLIVGHLSLSLMALLAHPPTQCSMEWWPTPVSLGMRSPMESPQQWLPVWLVGCGRLYQLVHVCYCNVYVQNTNHTNILLTQLWIVAPLPLVPMHLLEHPPAQLLEGQWPTPVTLGTGSLEETSQQRLPVWLVECGRLYQLVHVCYIVMCMFRIPTQYYLSLYTATHTNMHGLYTLIHGHSN